VAAKPGQSRKSGGKSAGRSAARKRLALALFAIVFAGLFVGFAVAEGVGEPSVPAGDVALVKNVPGEFGNVSEAEFKSSLAQQAGQAGVKTPPKKGEKKYEELKTAAMTELLQEAWIRGEAGEMDITVTKKEVETELTQIKTTNFKAKGSYQKFLKESNFTPADVEVRLEVQLLSRKVQEAVSKGAEPATSAEIEAYYEAEKATQFTTPESRDVRVIINEDKGEVEKAKAALEKDSSPAGWKKAAAKYSSDPSTKSKGGLQPGVTEEFVKGELKKAIFDHPTGELTGPFKVEKNYFLVEVVKLNPAKVKSLSEVKSQISATLTKQKQEEAFSEFVADFQGKWTSRTHCASGYVVELCANYVGTGHPSTAVESCYEANPKTPPTECPAPVTQISPALPGTVTVLKPKGEPLVQRPQPEATGSTGAASVPEGATTPPTGTPSGGASSGGSSSGE
jgi:parvulin-like peptidyl-prolyl isomerase